MAVNDAAQKEEEAATQDFRSHVLHQHLDNELVARKATSLVQKGPGRRG